MLLDTEALFAATKEKYEILYKYVVNMKVREKRNLFFVLRNVDTISTNTFLPHFFLFSGEFAVFQILSEHSRKRADRNNKLKNLNNEA